MHFSKQTLFKTSIFVNLRNNKLINELTNRSYNLNATEIEILHRFSRFHDSLESALYYSRHPDLKDCFERLVREKLLVPASLDETNAFFPHRVDIETCRQCNARCKYCPQSISQKTYGVMSIELFNIILSRLGSAKPQWIALNHYNEPLLDRHFKERVKSLREKGFLLRLFTNATLLTDSLISFLNEGGLYGVVFNFPSLEPREWSGLMQLPENFYSDARLGIENFLSSNEKLLNEVTVVVNGLTENQEQRAKSIESYFSAFGRVRVECAESHSRAGILDNALVRTNEHLAGQYFAGCKRFVGHLHVSWEGNVFLCCQDYDQKVILGNLRNETLESIMSSSKAKQLRAEIFGLSPMKKARICLKCPMLRTTRFPVNQEALADCELEVASELNSLTSFEAISI